jgi:hypothetical protein
MTEYHPVSRTVRQEDRRSWHVRSLTSGGALPSILFPLLDRLQTPWLLFIGASCCLQVYLLTRVQYLTVCLEMAALAPIFKKAYWALLFGISFYALSLIALTNPWLQRQ